MAIMKGSFAQSVLLNIEKTKQDVNDEVYRIARDLFTLIVNLTPARTPNPVVGPTAKGVLINNWFPMNGPEFSSATTDSRSAIGAGSLARIKSLVGQNFLNKDGTVTLSNNLDYAYRAEALGWPSPPWSGRIGPYRMVARSLQQIGVKYK